MSMALTLEETKIFKELKKKEMFLMMFLVI